MYKLTFDDKPEANTYIKWASQKGYKVEGPFREKLAKNAKKFDLNGKQRKYSYVVIRKRGGGPGAGGGGLDPVVRRKIKELRAEFDAKGMQVSDANIEKMAQQWYRETGGTVTSLGGGVAPSKARAQAKVVAREDRDAQLKLWWGGASPEEKTRLATSSGFRGNVGLKGVAELTPEQVMKLADKREEQKGKEPVFYMKSLKEADIARERLVAEGYKNATVKVKHVGDDESAGVQGYYTEPGAKEEPKPESTVIKQKAGAPIKQKTKDAAQALRESLEPPTAKRGRGRPKKEVVVEQKPIIAAPVYHPEEKVKAEAEVARARQAFGITKEEMHQKLVSDTEKLQIGSKAPPEPKTKKEGKESAIGKLIDAQAKAAAEAQERQQTFIGTQKARERAKGVIERDIARQKARKLTDAEQVAADFKARGTPLPSDWIKRQDERERLKKEQAGGAEALVESEKKLKAYYRSTKLTEAQRRPEGKRIKGKTFVETMAEEATASEPESIMKAYYTSGKLTKAQKEGKSWIAAMAREGKAVHDAATKKANKQFSDKKKLEKKLKKEGIDPAKRLVGISDYTKELEKYEGAKIEAIGKEKVAKAKATAEREKKYEKTFASYEEAAKWGKGQREVSKEEDIKEMKTRAQRMAGVMGDKEMTPEQKRAEIGRLGKEFEEVAKAKQARGGVGAKRKSYVVRTKKGFKVITGTKEELETPTSLKAALAKEKRKFKKRKKLLEKPLREIKRAKKVLRTTAKHGAKMLLRKPSSLVPLRGHHPAIGNVSMEYHRARIATPVIASRSIAGTYTT